MSVRRYNEEATESPKPTGQVCAELAQEFSQGEIRAFNKMLDAAIERQHGLDPKFNAFWTNEENIARLSHGHGIRTKPNKS